MKRYGNERGLIEALELLARAKAPDPAFREVLQSYVFGVHAAPVPLSEVELLAALDWLSHRLEAPPPQEFVIRVLMDN